MSTDQTADQRRDPTGGKSEADVTSWSKRRGSRQTPRRPETALVLKSLASRWGHAVSGATRKPHSYTGRMYGGSRRQRIVSSSFVTALRRPLGGQHVGDRCLSRHRRALSVGDALVSNSGVAGAKGSSFSRPRTIEASLLEWPPPPAAKRCLSSYHTNGWQGQHKHYWNLINHGLCLELNCNQVKKFLASHSSNLWNGLPHKRGLIKISKKFYEVLSCFHH